MSAIELTLEDVPALSLGCGVLGSGGGGSTDGPARILAHHLGGSARVPLLDALPADARVACIGAYGSATLLTETLPGPAVFRAALNALEAVHPRTQALLPIEVGGANGVLAALVATTTRLPLVDADPMGRAFSRLSDTVLAARLPMAELFFAGASGTTAHLRAASPHHLEQTLQSLLPSVGGWGAVVAFPGRADEVVPYAVRGALRLALALGQAMLRAAAGDPQELLAMDEVALVFDGWVTGVRRTPGVEVRGVASLSSPQRQPARLDFANEYVALFTAGELRVSVPDVLCVVDTAWAPVPVDEIRAGQQIRVLGVQAVADLRSAQRELGTFGLAGRGYLEVAG